MTANMTHEDMPGAMQLKHHANMLKLFQTQLQHLDLPLHMSSHAERQRQAGKTTKYPAI
jgi:hypothetical protein